LLSKVWQLTTVTTAAQLGVLPLSLFYFHQFPGLFFLSNLLIIPCLGLILGMGILVIFLALLNILPLFLVKSFQFSIDLLNMLVGWIAKQEHFLFQNISFDLLSMIGTYFTLIALVYYLSNPKAKRLMWVFVCVFLIQLVAIKNKWLLENKNEIVIIHKNRSSLLINKQGTEAKAYSSMNSLNLNEEYNLKNYRIGKNIAAVSSKKLPNIISLKGERLFIIDSLGVYDIPKMHPDYILLSNSPKINLNRVLEQHQVKTIIADGSNYTSFIKRWKQSCIKNKIPFHNTGEKGAYIISY
jgi:competence protein ComEC